MATSKTLQMILTLKDEATKKMQGFGNAVKNNSAAIKNAGKKITVMGGAITGIAVLAGAAAAELEATNAKYNTVFEGMTDTSDAFITEFKRLTPATQAEARSMASGIQDLLIPMGFARDEATGLTKDTLHLAGALTNFNSATHSAEDVTTALQSALTGEFQSLKKLGIQVDKEMLTQKALEAGLAATKDEVTNQMIAQVLLTEAYAQSGDALAAYNEESLDTKTKTLLLKSQMVDLSAKIGAAFLPMVNSLIEKIKPLVEKLTAWIDANPELAGKIAMVVAGIGGLMLVLGPLLVILPGIVIAVGVLTSATFLAIAPVLLVIAAIAALIAIGIWWIKNWDTVKAFFIAFWDIIKEKFFSAIDAIKNFFKNVWTGIKVFFVAIWEGIKTFIINVLTGIKDVIIATWTAISDFKQAIIDTISNFIKEKFNAIKNTISNILTGIKDFFITAWTTIKDFVINTITSLKDSVVEKVIGVKDAIVDGITTAVDWIKELPGKAWDWGVNMIQGLIDGIKSMGGTILSVVKGMIPDFIEPYIGFGSPTKKGAGRNIVKWGANMVKGFQDGIRNETANLKNTLNDVMSNSTVGIAGGGGGVVASGGGGAQGVGKVVYVTVTGNTFMGTPEEFASQIEASLQKRLQGTLKF